MIDYFLYTVPMRDYTLNRYSNSSSATPCLVVTIYDLLLTSILG
jgi:hypothetical protein